jgi:positive regulator of sigma E activity
MYIVPLIVIILLVLAVGFWTPIFAVGIAAVFFIGFLVYVGFSRRSDQQVPPPAGTTMEKNGEDIKHGIWGER